ncbi:C40 family peptidase [Streptomyces sp. DSM 15324]|uniref:C40 family peptidase n=1 Tax=Streptomyces sp. DSM 15324 TaxID=1739111 RepID=UPI0007499E4E|nr:C40 family peptidase [Streptomyces sp. DSM 15324]KUO12022.1 glycoside hydrolase [Streptomyces sp. DSM 15324]
MASQHRKPRFLGSRVAGIRTPGLATAAFTSVALLSQSANAAPSDDGTPSLEEVEKKLDDLYRRAESAPEKDNGAKERKTRQRKRVDGLLEDVAPRTRKLNEAREEPGSFAAARYRTGASAPDTAAFLTADSPRDHVDRTQPRSRLTDRQKGAADDYVTGQSATMRERQEAAESLAALGDTESELKTAKAAVQKKLGDARELLARLTARERAAASSPAASPSAASPSAASSDSSYISQAEKALAFARAQIGKPYVWGATGPDSYDCSGLTQAAWRAAGVSLPRTTHDQANAGTTVSLADARPGDLVFFHDDISHVGIHLGNGMMIHAPKPGTYVREESIHYDGESGVHSVVRPA